MQTTAIRTVANLLPKNELILLTLLISRRYIPYTDLRKISGIIAGLQQINAMEFGRRDEKRSFLLLHKSRRNWNIPSVKNRDIEAVNNRFLMKASS